jgi:hypothetical protein
MFGIGLSELAFLFLLGGGLGLPLGVPPGTEDEILARLAPEKCLVCLAWNGTTRPDPKSPNQTEQLLAEPEVQKLLAGIGHAVVHKLGSEQNAVLWVKTLLSRPAIFYLGKMTLNHSGAPPRDVQAGLVVNTGELTDKIRASLEKFQARLPQQMLKPLEIDGQRWYRIDDGQHPVVTWGAKEQYLGFAIGEGEGEAILRRADGKPPRWLTAALERLSLPRRGSLLYVNVKYLLETLATDAPSNYKQVLRVTGLDGITSVASLSGLDEIGFACRTHVTFDGPPRGIFKALAGKPLAAKDLATIPADSQLASAGRLDAGKLFDAIMAITKEIEPAAAERNAAELTEANHKLGLNLRQDLLGALGDVWTTYSSPGEGVMFPFGLTAAVSVRDAARLRAAQDRLLAVVAHATTADDEKKGKFVRTTIEGRTVLHYEFRQTPIPISPGWTIGDHHVVGSLTVQNLKGFLLRKPDTKSLADVPVVASWLREGQGTLAVSYQDTAGLFRAFYPTLMLFAGSMGQQLREADIDFDMTLLPSTNAIAQHLRPSLSVVRQVSDGFEFDTRGTVVGGNLFVMGPFVAGLTLPAVNAARTAARRTTSMNNLKQLLIALATYQDAHHSFPPACTVDKQGRPLLSWRVAILPYLDEEALYRQFHLDEPWDSPHNKQLIARMPPLFRSPRSTAASGKTCYLAVRGKNTVFPGAEKVTLSDIRDGLSNTIAIVEVNDTTAVEWTRPDDFQPDPKQPTKGLQNTWRGNFLAGFADGHVCSISVSVDAATLRAMFTRNGGEPIATQR